MPKAALVLTTIFDPVILDDYHANFNRYGRLEDVEVFVIPDRKTPASAYETCERLSLSGLKITMPSVQEQDCYLKRLGLGAAFVPYDSDNRRNLGFLMALERRSDFLISIDDDNYCLPDEDCFAEHARVVGEAATETVSSASSGFFNVCNLLQFDKAITVYPRGYPYFARHKVCTTENRQAKADVMINAGLWLNDPDVDAITWLGLNPCAESFKNLSVVLDRDAWSPVNSQNTALRGNLIPAYYFVRMGYPLAGANVDRYGDIFSGYFALACAKHLGGTARFGTPIADHRRNRHDYLRDAAAEWNAILLLEDVLRWLKDFRLEGSNCPDAYVSLSHGLQAAVEKFHGSAWTDSARGFFHQMAFCMRTWAEACKRLGAE